MDRTGGSFAVVELPWKSAKTEGSCSVASSARNPYEIGSQTGAVTDGGGGILGMRRTLIGFCITEDAESSPMREGVLLKYTSTGKSIKSLEVMVLSDSSGIEFKVVIVLVVFSRVAKADDKRSCDVGADILNPLVLEPPKSCEKKFIAAPRSKFSAGAKLKLMLLFVFERSLFELCEDILLSVRNN
jgi:hypothetical protein